MQTIQVQKQIMEIVSDTSLSFPLTLSLLHFGGYFYLFKLLFSIWGYADNRQNVFLNKSSEQQVLFIQLTLEATSFFFLYWLKSPHFGSNLTIMRTWYGDWIFGTFIVMKECFRKALRMLFLGRYELSFKITTIN